MIPAAWYDLTGRIAHARAVIGCIGESLPCSYGLPREVYDAINDAANLVGAVQDLLDLATADLDRMEKELNAAG